MKFFTKTSLIEKIIIMLIVVMIFIQISKLNRKVEGFTIQEEKYKVYENDDLFDTFYSEIYDQVLLSPAKNLFEVNEITKIVSTKDKKLLDVGCGLGHQAALFSLKGFDCVGIDKSKAMVSKAKKNYADVDFMVGDVMSSMTFNNGSFNIITMLYFTVYYFENKIDLFSNCYNWLDYKGYLVVHVVEKTKFDPIVPGGNPISNLSVQDYTDKRITKSIIHFDKFKYTSNFELKNNNMGEFKETIKFTAGNVRENRHKLYFDTITKITNVAQTVGFDIVKKIDMKPCHYEHQYLIVFQK